MGGVKKSSVRTFANIQRSDRQVIDSSEIEGLVGTSAAPAVLSYLFHRIGDRLDGRPTLLIIDEGWLALDDTGFAGQLREWLKTLRKKNASVVFATQSLADIDGSAIAPAILWTKSVPATPRGCGKSGRAMSSSTTTMFTFRPCARARSAARPKFRRSPV